MDKPLATWSRTVQGRSKSFNLLCAFSFWGTCRSSFVDLLHNAQLQTSSLKRSRAFFCKAGIEAGARGSALSLRLQGYAGASRLDESCRIWECMKSAQANFTALLQDSYFPTASRGDFKVFLMVLKAFVRNPRGRRVHATTDSQAQGKSFEA